MAIALDSASAIQDIVPGSGSWTHVCTGSNLVLVVNLVNESGDHTTSCTYNGTAMTQVQKVACGSRMVYQYVLINPSTGSHSVTIAGTGECDASSISYTGANQSSQPDAFNSLAQTSAAAGDHVVTVSVVASGCWLVMTYTPLTANPASTVNATLQTPGAILGNSGASFDSNGTVGTGSQTIGLHWNATDTHTLLALSLAPVATATVNSNFLAFM